MSNFHIYPAFAHSNRPTNDVLSDAGMSMCGCIYESNIWPTGGDRSEPPMDRIAQLAKAASAGYGFLDCFVNLETWPVYGSDAAAVEKNIRKYVQTAAAIKLAHPKLRFGFYGVIPDITYYNAMQPEGEAHYVAWQKANKQIAPIASFVDFIMPSIYPRYDSANTIDTWTLLATRKIEAAKLYGKPVIPFISPRLCPTRDGGLVSLELWRYMLDLVRNTCPACVVFDGWNDATQSRMAWDNDAEWWIELQTFIKGI